MPRDCGTPKIPALSVEIQSAGRLRLRGELDRSTCGLVEAVLTELTATELLVDVAQLRFADAAGLRVLAAEDARRRVLRGRVVLLDASLLIRQTLRAAGLSHLLPCHSKPKADECWRTKAACRDVPTQLFFDQPQDQEMAAKELCFRCPVAGPCLAYALRTNQQSGVWGGLTAGERSLLKKPGAPGRPAARTPS